MTVTTPVMPEPSGFAAGPELILLGLGALATILIVGIFFWLIRGMIREDALYNEQENSDSEESA